jgi:hypothetical protein
MQLNKKKSSLSLCKEGGETQKRRKIVKNTPLSYATPPFLYRFGLFLDIFHIKKQPKSANGFTLIIELSVLIKQNGKLTKKRGGGFNKSHFLGGKYPA